MLLTVAFIFFALHILAWLVLPSSAHTAAEEAAADTVLELDAAESVAA